MWCVYVSGLHSDIYPRLAQVEEVEVQGVTCIREGQAIRSPASWERVFPTREEAVEWAASVIEAKAQMLVETAAGLRAEIASREESTV